MATHCTHHSQCPNCRKTGHDNAHDNLAVYSDGSSYCFRCGYHTSASGLAKLLTKTTKPVKISKNVNTLPFDVSEDLPATASNFLNKFDLTKNDIKTNLLMWSEHYQRLIFPYFNDMGIAAWQGRYLGEEKKSKWYNKGDLRSLDVVKGNRYAKTVVLCEDIISAIKIAHCPKVCVVPLFGTHVSTKRMLQLAEKYDTIFVWLDFDMKHKALSYAQQLRLVNSNSSVIYTKKDPKSLTDVEISDILNGKLHGT